MASPASTAAEANPVQSAQMVQPINPAVQALGHMLQEAQAREAHWITQFYGAQAQIQALQDLLAIEKKHIDD